MADKNNIDNNVVSDIYEYIKCVDEKVMQNDKTLKFMSSLQSEQMKELIQSKTDNLKKFFEDAIRLQTEVVRNAYEEIIENIKSNYEQEIKNIEMNNFKINNQKELTLKAAYENQITALKESMENNFKKQTDEMYLNFAKEKQTLTEEMYLNFEKEKQALADKVYLDTKNEFEKEKQILADKVYEDTKNNCEREYQERIYEIKAWHEKNLYTKLEEQKNYFYAEMEKRSSESYTNGKSEVEGWHNDILRQKLEVQATYFEEEIRNAFEQGKKVGKEEMKAEMYEEMDEASKRNEAELKLFLDYYENKIRHFKKLINIHEATERNIKNLHRRIKNKINKTLGKKDLMIPPDNTYEKCKELEMKLKNNQETDK